MKIGVLQASSQADKNQLLFESTKRAVQRWNYEVINLGITWQESETWSYIDTAVVASLCLCSQAVDFIVTGCSPGQGMMLACNSMPGILCGYVPTPADAFLFGRINHGNAASLPLGLGFGWAGEINLAYTLQALFDTPLELAPQELGYPPADAARKAADTMRLKQYHAIFKTGWETVRAENVDTNLMRRIERRFAGLQPVIDYVGGILKRQ